MKTSWLCATLLPLFLFSCALPEKQCQWKDNLSQIKHVQVYNNVSVSCPKFTAMEMTFTLYKDRNQIAWFTWGNFSLSNFKSLVNRISHYIDTDSNTTYFVLHNVTVNDTSLYTCTAKRSYPPPLVDIPEEPQTIVIVDDHVCVQNGQKTEKQKRELSTSHLLLWVLLAVLVLYGLIVTLIAIFLKLRLKSEQMSSHDYMNMKPRTRRKNQGIHHPTNHSWCKDTNGTAASKKISTK